MEKVTCIVVGGPSHGMVIQQPWNLRQSTQPSVIAADGASCAAAARRRDGATGTHYLLLHPRATGAQFLTMLAA